MDRGPPVRRIRWSIARTERPSARILVWCFVMCAVCTTQVAAPDNATTGITFNECFEHATQIISDSSCPESGEERTTCISSLLSTSILPCFKHTTMELIHVLAPDVGEGKLIQSLIQRANDFNVITGAQVVVHGVALHDLEDVVNSDIMENDLFYAGWIIPTPCLPPLAESGALMDIELDVMADRALDWEDITTYFQQDTGFYEGKLVAIPMDGDMMLLYYRKDVLKENKLSPPTTWEGVLDLAQTFNGTDMNGDGVGDYGICLGRKAGAEEMFWINSIMAPYFQFQGTSQGLLFDPDTLDPLVDNVGMAWVFELYNQLQQNGPPNQKEHSAETLNYELFKEGRCLMTLYWGSLFKDLGKTDFAPNVGITPLPGSWYVYDRQLKDIQRCTEKVCRFGRPDDGGNIVNYAPYSAFGGLLGTVNALAPKASRQGMLRFLSYVASRAVSFEMVTATSVLDPYRWSHLRIDRWRERGWEHSASLDYINAVSRSVISANVAKEPYLGSLREPLTHVLQETIEVYVNAAGSIAVETLLVDMRTNMTSAISEYGREEFLRDYRRYLHLPYTPAEPTEPKQKKNSQFRIDIILVIISMLIVFIVAMYLLHLRNMRNGLKERQALAAPGAGPQTSLVVTDIQDSTKFWEVLDANVMDTALSLHNDCIRRVLRENCGYESATEGDSFILAFHTPHDAARFCICAQVELMKVDWPEEVLKTEFCPTLYHHPTKDTFKKVCAKVVRRKKGKRESKQDKPKKDIHRSSLMDMMSTMFWFGNPVFNASPRDQTIDTSVATPSTVREGQEVETPSDEFWKVDMNDPEATLKDNSTTRDMDSTYSATTPNRRAISTEVEESSVESEPETPDKPPSLLETSLISPATRLRKMAMRKAQGDDAEKPRTTFRGLRVRMGLHTGIESADDVDVNEASNRTMYSGVSMGIAKAVSDAAHGGQVLISEATYKAIPLETITEHMHVLHCGEHRLADDLPTMQIYELVSNRTPGRIPEIPPIRTEKTLSIGWSDAPSGDVCLSFTFVVGAEVLAQWNKNIFKTALQMFEDTGRSLLREYDGYQVEAADGLLLSSFRNPPSAVAWALRLHEDMWQVDWPDELLQHELCDELELLELTPNGEEAIKVLRGLRLKTGIERGRAKVNPHATTGRMAYRGKVINRAARLAKFAIAGQVLCSGSVWKRAADDPTIQMMSAFGRSLGEHSLKGVSRPLELYNLVLERTLEIPEMYGVHRRSIRGDDLERDLPLRNRESGESDLSVDLEEENE